MFFGNYCKYNGPEINQGLIFFHFGTFDREEFMLKAMCIY